MHPRVKRALIWIQYCCPDRYIDQRWCRFVKPEEIRRNGNGKQFAQLASEAEQELQQVDRILDAKDRAPEKRQQTLQQCELEVAKYLLKKYNRGEEKAASIHTLTQKVMCDSDGPSTDVGTSASTDGPDIFVNTAVSFTDDGRPNSWAAYLREKGISEGVYLRCKVDDRYHYAVLHKLGEHDVVLRTTDDAGKSTFHTETAEFVHEAFEVVYDKDEIVSKGVVSNLRFCGASTNSSYRGTEVGQTSCREL